MADSSREIRRAVKEYILSEFLPGEDPETLSDDTPLITGGILDSIQVTQLVIFLEKSYGLEFRVQDINADRIGTLERIARVVQIEIGKNA